MAITVLAVVGITMAGLSSRPLLASAGSMGESGPDAFRARCAACHGADGSGDTPAGKSLKVRDMRSAEVQGQSDGDLLNIISKGKGKMPSYDKKLGADTCGQLVQVVRSFRK